jgi:hypothetical protein
VAAERVELLDLRPGGIGDDRSLGGGSDSWVATLGLTRPEALRLIQADSFARSVRLIGAQAG